MSLFAGSAFSSSNPSSNAAQQQQQPQQQSGGLFSGLGSQSQQQNSSPFGSSTQPQQSKSLFGASSSQPQQSTGLFGSAPQQQQSTGLFGSTSQQPQQSTGLFGSASQQPQQSTGILGGQPQQQSTSLFGGLTGNATQQQQQQQPLGGLLFGASQQQPQQQSTGFGLSLGQNQQTQQQPQQGGLLSQSLQQPSSGSSSIWQPGNGVGPHQKSIPEQMQLIAEKWDPSSSNCAFQHYFYNYVPERHAVYYRPTPEEDEKKWEEALSKKPREGAIPVLGKGFKTLGHRLEVQVAHVNALQTRLHEINNCLTIMLQNHDLVISIRATDARRKHLALSQRCLALATRVQVLRNRGYAMDGAEEELKKKLVTLEREVFDPALSGRGEEIWARMVGVRERARILQEEFEKAGKNLANGQVDVMDDEVMKKAAKILDDYNAQLKHLRKETEGIQKELDEWEKGVKPATAGSF
ncbi:MAG: hypothetical protein M1819_005154 [Sarea resinae]|nr:MAG: hypothetical protein M1819_005154 [Sarea resinae]